MTVAYSTVGKTRENSPSWAQSQQRRYPTHRSLGLDDKKLAYSHNETVDRVATMRPQSGFCAAVPARDAKTVRKDAEIARLDAAG
jgi:hypothetical protein